MDASWFTFQASSAQIAVRRKDLGGLLVVWPLYAFVILSLRWPIRQGFDGKVQWPLKKRPLAIAMATGRDLQTPTRELTQKPQHQDPHFNVP